jgi:hypothetical protein
MIGGEGLHLAMWTTDARGKHTKYNQCASNSIHSIVSYYYHKLLEHKLSDLSACRFWLGASVAVAHPMPSILIDPNH